jgi:hypothetical protein
MILGALPQNQFPYHPHSTGAGGVPSTSTASNLPCTILHLFSNSLLLYYYLATEKIHAESIFYTLMLLLSKDKD